MPWKSLGLLSSTDPNAHRGHEISVSKYGPTHPHDIYPDHWWEDDLWKALQRADLYRNVIASIKLSDPPDQAQTRNELDDILSHPSKPDFQARIPEIIEEAEGPPAYYRRMLFLDEKRRPQTGVIFSRMIVWSHPFIMHFKHKWKRPRPTQLEPRIRPVVDCPLHPAYPSGHSTQSHLIALILEKVTGRADVRDALWDAADRIAQNREYAGIHYMSDSKGGAELAKQLVVPFMEEHAAMIDKARKEEWG